MKKIVILTGAGISAESGLRTFRDSGGLWEGHDVTKVASPEGWQQNSEMVLNFYNERRKQAKEAKPNEAHKIIASLQSAFDVHVITQNVDDLHERAGSKKVLHLHGSLFEKRSSFVDDYVVEERGDIVLGDLAEDGSQYRPNIVWFGEPVPRFTEAIEITDGADYFIVVGTSLVVYPASSLIGFVQASVPKYIIDPNISDELIIPEVHKIHEVASIGMRRISEMLA